VNEPRLMIETRGLTKQYDDVTALGNLWLQVAAGELYGFIGPNGAGKTTTIHILSTLLAPTMGEAYVAGLDVRQEGREVRRKIGYMPDFFGVYPSLRVWEYLEFFAAAYEVPPGERRRILGDVLELTGLGARRDSLVGALSRGMQQRLGLARVLIHDPDVLLLDEPASGLDPRARLEVREILRELQAMGKTILLSSHHLSELAEICTSIGILLRGKLVVSGPVQEVLAEVGAQEVVRVELEGPASRAVEVLAAMPGIDTVDEPEVGGVEGRALLRLHVGVGTGPPEIAAFLAEKGFRLHALEKEKLNLEEVYLRLTEEEDGGVA
jgi:ABC-2 type transport system ATP-binding protein